MTNVIEPTNVVIKTGSKTEETIREELEETIEISKSDYYSLVQIASWSMALEKAGVNEWSGIDRAYEIYGETNGE